MIRSSFLLVALAAAGCVVDPGTDPRTFDVYDDEPSYEAEAVDQTKHPYVLFYAPKTPVVAKAIAAAGGTALKIDDAGKIFRSEDAVAAKSLIIDVPFGTKLPAAVEAKLVDWVAAKRRAIVHYPSIERGSPLAKALRVDVGGLDKLPADAAPFSDAKDRLGIWPAKDAGGLGDVAIDRRVLVKASKVRALKPQGGKDLLGYDSGAKQTGAVVETNGGRTLVAGFSYADAEPAPLCVAPRRTECTYGGSPKGAVLPYKLTFWREAGTSAVTTYAWVTNRGEVTWKFASATPGLKDTTQSENIWAKAFEQRRAGKGTLRWEPFQWSGWVDEMRPRPRLRLDDIEVQFVADKTSAGDMINTPQRYGWLAGLTPAKASEMPSDLKKPAADPAAPIDDLLLGEMARAKSFGGTCRIQAGLLGLAAGLATVALTCTLAAPATGGVTLVCTAPAGLIAGLAAGASLLVSLAAQTNCGGQQLPRNTQVRIVAATAAQDRCDDNEKRRRTQEYKRDCGNDQYDGHLECTNNRNVCFYRGADAQARAEAGEACARGRRHAQRCFSSSDPGWEGHQTAIDDVAAFARACRGCI
jgi:hypothetical protein